MRANAGRLAGDRAQPIYAIGGHAYMPISVAEIVADNHAQGRRSAAPALDLHRRSVSREAMASAGSVTHFSSRAARRSRCRLGPRGGHLQQNPQPPHNGSNPRASLDVAKLFRGQLPRISVLIQRTQFQLGILSHGHYLYLLMTGMCGRSLVNGTRQRHGL